MSLPSMKEYGKMRLDGLEQGCISQKTEWTARVSGWQEA